MLGTATSGQAARTLGAGARIPDSRTLAGLLGRIERRQLELDEQSVVIVDEAGMTDDRDLARLSAQLEAAGGKLIVVGDHRQLGAVGPGGALAALVARHPDALHQLTENRRQADPDERHALAQLRDGEVSAAVDWYSRHDRVHAVADRDSALQATVDAWAADTAAGHDVGLYAWRRANVTELNHRARDWMAATGRLNGPELTAPGGARYRAGDQVVTLAPNPQQDLVTSQRAQVTGVDPDAGAITVRTGDGRDVRLAGDDIGAERLGHAYATTVHRAQGATTDRAHLYADGGGRELAYVAMSRARHGAHAWVVADDPDQAAEDLRRDWATQRTPAWALDTALPAASIDRQQLGALPAEEQAGLLALYRARAVAVGQDLTRVGPPDHQRLESVKSQLEAAQAARADLFAGTGTYQDHKAGRALRDLAEARQAKETAAWSAEHADRRRDRRAAAKELEAWTEREADAASRWDAHVRPEAARLDAEITELESDIDALTTLHARQAAAARAVMQAGAEQQGAAQGLARRLDDRRARVDGVPTVAEARHAAAIARRRQPPRPTTGPEAAPQGRAPEL